MSIKIETEYIEEFWNPVCQATIPGYWKAWVSGHDMPVRTHTGWQMPAKGAGDTEQEAIKNLKEML